MTITKTSLLERIIQARTDAGLSQRAASQKTGEPGWSKRGDHVSQSAWFRIEDGQRVPTWDSLFTMAEALGMTIDIKVTSPDQ